MEPLDAARLLEHDGFVRGLACRLLADPVRADDVVQDAWLAALQKPPRRGWNLKAWLAGVVRNRSRNIVREEARRDIRERRAARPEATGSTAELLAHEARRRDVISAVLALNEAQREIVLLRFFEGLPPREIARRLGVPGSTVRTRLARALDRLRSSLHQRYGGEREWSLALVSVASPARLGIWTALAGVIAMKTKITAAVLGIAALAALFAWGAKDEAPRTDREARASDPVSRRAPAPPQTNAGSAAPPASTDRSRRRVLRGRVSSAERFDARQVTIVVRSAGAAPRRYSIDAASFDLKIADVAATAGTIQAEHPRMWSRPVSMSGTPAQRVELTLVPAALIAGRVAGPADAPHAVVAVYALARDGIPFERPVAVGRTAGEFRLGVIVPGPHLIVAVREGFVPWSTTARLTLRETFSFPPIVLQRGLEIGGRVTLANGEAIAGIEVEVRQAEGRGKRLELPGFAIRFHAGRVHLDATRARTDADGGYRASGLAAVEHAVACASIPGCHPGALRNARRVPEYRRVATAPRADIDFTVGLAILDVVCTAAGAPRPDTQLEIFQRMYVEGNLKWWSQERYTTNSSGRLRLLVRPGTHYVVESRESEFKPARHEITTPVAGKRAEFAVALEPAAPRSALSLQFVAESGAALPSTAVVTLRSTDQPGEKPERRSVPVIKNRCAVPGIRPGNYAVTVRLGAAHGGDVAHFLDARLRAQLRPGKTADRMVTLTRGGRIEITVLTPDGRSDLPCNCELTDARGSIVDVLYTKFADGRMMSTRGAIANLTGPAYIDETLPSGRYALRVTPPIASGYASREIAIEVEPGKTVERLVRLN